MSNISFFFPKRMQGLSLGLNAGLGNVGVSVMQVLLPFVMTFGVFGALGGASRRLPEALGGERSSIQNAGLVWVPVLAVLAFVAWLGMNNLPIHEVGGAAAPRSARCSGSRSWASPPRAWVCYLLVGLGVEHVARSSHHHPAHARLHEVI